MKMISDFMWKEIEPLIPAKASTMGRPPMSSLKALNGIFYILKTGAPWRYLPREFGAASTVHGRFRLWIKNGIFDKIMQKAVSLYIQNLVTPITWYATDTSSCKAPLARWSGKNPTDRGKRGVKKSIIVDLKGAPLAISVGPANRHDSKFFKITLMNLHGFIPGVAKIMAADSAYDDKKLRNICKQKNFALLAATNIRRDKNKKPYKPSFRWVVERTFGWLAWHRGLKTCWTKTVESFEAFLKFAASAQLFKMCGVFG
jgi:transposase